MDSVIDSHNARAVALIAGNGAILAKCVEISTPALAWPPETFPIGRVVAAAGFVALIGLYLAFFSMPREAAPQPAHRTMQHWSLGAFAANALGWLIGVFAGA